MPTAEIAQMEAAVVKPLMLSPSFMMTPAQRKPTPVTIPWATRVGSTSIRTSAPPYNSGTKPTKMVNAVEAMPRGGRLVVTSYIGRNGLELEVADSGPGLSDEARRRAFEPYYTTKRDKTGVGLSVVRGIARAHGGDVVAANCPEGGAAFTLRFPPTVSRAAA